MDTMATLIEELPGRIARLEALHGPNDLFVRDLKEQLRASKATLGKSAQEVFRMQAVPLPASKTANPQNPMQEAEDANIAWFKQNGMKPLGAARPEPTPSEPPAGTSAKSAEAP